MAGVRLEAVTKRFGDVVVIPELDLVIPDRQFTVLVGPSGCGKTTTLRLVAGLETPSSGEVYIGERKVTRLPPKDRDIAMVFQSYALYPHMTVWENMAFGLKLRKMPRDEIERRVREAAGILGLEALLGRYPKELSGGQRQRVAMGRAIVRRPAVFLFDEPLSNLDAKLRGEMRREIARLHRRLGTTVLYVTHDQVEAMTLGDVVVVLKDGRIQQVGSPLELYDRPANRFVAGFIGSPSMNFVEVELERRSGGLVARAEGLEVALPPGRFSEPDGGRAVLGIRPSDVEVVGPEASGDTTGTVEVREPMGAEAFLTVRTGFGSLLVRVDAHHEARVSDQVCLVFDRDRIQLFDPGDEGSSLRQEGE